MIYIKLGAVLLVVYDIYETLHSTDFSQTNYLQGVFLEATLQSLWKRQIDSVIMYSTTKIG